MLRIAGAGSFFSSVAGSTKLKLALAWLTFVGLALPTAFLMSFGVPEKYALPVLAALVLPFNYIAFWLLRAVQQRNVTDKKPKTASWHPGYVSGQFATLDAQIARVSAWQPVDLYVCQLAVLLARHYGTVKSSADEYLAKLSEQRLQQKVVPTLTFFSPIPSADNRNEAIDHQRRALEPPTLLRVGVEVLPPIGHTENQRANYLYSL